jgi:hypothetical protein
MIREKSSLWTICTRCGKIWPLLDASAPLRKAPSFLGHSAPKIAVKAYYPESEGLQVEDFIDVELRQTVQ